MEKSKRIGSAVIATMIVLNIFVGLAAAATVVEPPDVSGSKSSAYTIYCPNYAASNAYQADIYTGSDVDWFKCSVNSGDIIQQFLDSAYYSNVSLNAEDQNGNFIERLSNRYGDAPPQGTFNPVWYPPVYTKAKNDDVKVYYGYQFFIGRNWP